MSDVFVLVGGLKEEAKWCPCLVQQGQGAPVFCEERFWAQCTEAEWDPQQHACPFAQADFKRYRLDSDSMPVEVKGEETSAGSMHLAPELIRKSLE